MRSNHYIIVHVHMTIDETARDRVRVDTVEKKRHETRAPDPSERKLNEILIVST